jgi:hypothetical protein
VVDKPLTVSPFRAKPKIERLAKDQGTPKTLPTAKTSETPVVHTKPDYDASLQHHEGRSRDVRREVGKTLNETRNQSAGSRHDPAQGAAALLLKEKSSPVDQAAFNALAVLHGFRKETRGEGNALRVLVDVVHRAITDGASAFVTSSALEALPHAFASANVRALLETPSLVRSLHSATLKDPAELLYTMLNTPKGAADQLATIVANPHFQSADADAQLSWLAGFRVRVSLPPQSQANLERFLWSSAFCNLPGDVQATMFRVVRETGGDAAIINGLVRVAETPSFQAMPVASKMAFATVVGATLERIRTGTEMQRTVLRNSLERLLEPNGIPVVLESLRSSTLGMADVEGHRIVLNANFRHTNSDDVNHLATHTLAHEVNHILNEPNEIAPPYERFMGEYRAWCVGFVAEHGRWPRCDEGAERIDHLLDVDGAYRGIGRAALGNDDDGKSIRRFAQLFARIPKGDDAPLPDPPGDLLNDGIAR